jgi:hypothetical protein
MSGYRVRPGKGASAVGLVASVAIGVVGCTMLSSVSTGPGMSAFLLLWVLVTGAGAIYYGYDLVSDRGVSEWEIHATDRPWPPPVPREDRSATSVPNAGAFDERLRRLEGLRADGLITEAEYERKRTEILAERW